MKNFYKLFFFLNLILMPKTFLMADQSGSLGDLMDSRVTDVREGAGIASLSIGQTVGLGIRLVLSLLAIIFLILVIMAGFKWMTAGGNQETIAKAQKSLKETIIGLLIVLAAYAITWYIFYQLQLAEGFGIGSGMPGPD